MSESMSPSNGTVEASRTPFRRLDASAAWDLIFERGRADRDRLVVFDLRDEASFAQSHVDGAVRLSDARFSEALAETPRASTIVVYCYHGIVSQLCASLFSSFGFAEVFSVDGGFEALAKEHAERRAFADAEDEDEDVDERPSRGEPELRYLTGDVVFSREAIQNDGGLPGVAPDALIASAGARGVVVQVGRAEADPRRTVYAVRFEDERGELGPAVGCLPEELTQQERRSG